MELPMARALRHALIAGIAWLAAVAAVMPAAAEKPPGGPPGHSKRGGANEAPSYGGPQPATAPGGPTIIIVPRDQTIIRQYFGQQFAAGHCPPGLAKKNNGCQPPGQAKKWSQGQPLPGGVPYYALPQDLLRQLLPPPPGNQYVRVANDVLLMSTGSRMILDAVRDLGRL
jgi:Ni/Co efflux regulator RcnB